MTLHTQYYQAKTTHSVTLTKSRTSDIGFFTYNHIEYPAVLLVTLSLSSTGFALKRNNYPGNTKPAKQNGSVSKQH